MIYCPNSAANWAKNSVYQKTCQVIQFHSFQSLLNRPNYCMLLKKTNFTTNQNLHWPIGYYTVYSNFRRILSHPGYYINRMHKMDTAQQFCQRFENHPVLFSKTHSLMERKHLWPWLVDSQNVGHRCTERSSCVALVDSVGQCYCVKIQRLRRRGEAKIFSKRCKLHFSIYSTCNRSHDDSPHTLLS